MYLRAAPSHANLENVSLIAAQVNVFEFFVLWMAYYVVKVSRVPEPPAPGRADPQAQRSPLNVLSLGSSLGYGISAAYGHHAPAIGGGASEQRERLFLTLPAVLLVSRQRATN